jgi:hypothetical protein
MKKFRFMCNLKVDFFFTNLSSLYIVFFPHDAPNNTDAAGVHNVHVGAGEGGVESHEVVGVVVAEGAKVVGVAFVAGQAVHR